MSRALDAIIQKLPIAMIRFDEQFSILEITGNGEAKVFNQKTEVGTNLIDLLSKVWVIETEVRSMMEETVRFSHGMPVINFIVNQNKLPIEMVAIDQKMEDHLSLAWHVAENNGAVEEMMVILQVIPNQSTGHKVSAGGQLAILSEIISVGAISTERFISNTKYHLDLARRAQANDVDEPPMKVVFRSLHTVKGNARQYGFTHISSRFHHFECTLTKYNGDTPVEDVKELPQLIKDFEDIIEFYQDLCHAKLTDLNLDSSGQLKIVSRTDQPSTSDQEGSNDFFLFDSDNDGGGEDNLFDSGIIYNAEKCIKETNVEDIEQVKNAFGYLNFLFKTRNTETLESIISKGKDGLPRTCEILGKPVPDLDLSLEDIRIESSIAPIVEDIFVHLLNNSCDHGIAKPEKRKDKGKPAKGTIFVKATMNFESLLIRFYDDGDGLNLGIIKKLGLSKKLIKEDAPAQEIADLIFNPGFSTQYKVSEISGRGVGMDAVQGFIRGQGGNISVELKGEKDANNMVPFEFEITLPVGFAINISNPRKAG